MKITPLKWYQYISKFTPKSCRYYPSCSEYAKWLYELDNPLFATIKTTKRVLSCNQLFPGGIDYPKIAKKNISPMQLKNPIFKASYLTFNKKESKLRIKYWLVPTNKEFLILKDFDATATYLPT